MCETRVVGRFEPALWQKNPSLSYYLIRVCAQPATTCCLVSLSLSLVASGADFAYFFFFLLNYSTLSQVVLLLLVVGLQRVCRRRHTRSRNGLTAPQKCALFWCCCCSYCQSRARRMGTANPFLAIRRRVQRQASCVGGVKTLRSSCVDNDDDDDDDYGAINYTPVSHIRKT